MITRAKAAPPQSRYANLIVTPDEVIQCPNRRRPRGMVWNGLTAEKIAQIPVLSARLGSG
ncbi:MULTISPECIES: hypothetical protein [Streptomyces]|uniref:hypothetical protein n=1 Tax=Streptomyces TaxID=1883 RepID=UPI0029CA13F8|nr:MULTISPECIES: hypothetical protein [Streptomyces]